jgi:hypothetical protein
MAAVSAYEWTPGVQATPGLRPSLGRLQVNGLFGMPTVATISGPHSSTLLRAPWKPHWLSFAECSWQAKPGLTPDLWSAGPQTQPLADAEVANAQHVVGPRYLGERVDDDRRTCAVDVVANTDDHANTCGESGANAGGGILKNYALGGVDVDSFRAGQIRLWMRFSVHNVIGRHDDGSGDAGSGEP